jgi:phospholipid/cholesterol/gamma-HCH transport system substrate-binding protein
MAQRKQLTWTELRVGLFVLVGLILIAVGVFYVTGMSFLGPKYRLYTYLPDVEGLQVGAPVRLDGVDIGNVAAIKVNDHPSNRMNNIQLVMRINKKYQEDVRSDSIAQLKTEGVLGNRYVNISRGVAGQALRAEGTVPGGEEVAIKQVVERSAALLGNLQTLSEQIGEVVDKVQNGQGTLGKLLSSDEIYNRMNDTVGRLQAIVAGAQQGQGTIGKLVASDELYNKTSATIGHAEALLADVQAQKGTLGKLVYDPSMYDESKQFVERGNSMLQDIQAGKGSLGKFVTDDTVFANLRDASANVRDATGKLNAGQGTLGKFFADPQLYDNLTGMTGDLRILIGQFRQNPKKFLHVKLSIF